MMKRLLLVGLLLAGTSMSASAYQTPGPARGFSFSTAVVMGSVTGYSPTDVLGGYVSSSSSTPISLVDSANGALPGTTRSITALRLNMVTPTTGTAPPSGFIGWLCPSAPATTVQDNAVLNLSLADAGKCDSLPMPLISADGNVTVFEWSGPPRNLTPAANTLYLILEVAGTGTGVVYTPAAVTDVSVTIQGVH